MGELVDLCGELSFDGNQILESVHYSDGALAAHRDIRVSDAVAASALVPGVFKPYSIPNLYDGVAVALVDGGIYDNYGLQTLYHDSCDLIIVSDGSAKLQDDPNPSRETFGVVNRSLKIAQDLLFERISRELQERTERNGTQHVIRYDMMLI